MSVTTISWRKNPHKGLWQMFVDGSKQPGFVIGKYGEITTTYRIFFPRQLTHFVTLKNFKTLGDAKNALQDLYSMDIKHPSEDHRILNFWQQAIHESIIENAKALEIPYDEALNHFKFTVMQSLDFLDVLMNEELGLND